MNRAIKEANVKRFYYDTYDQFHRHLDDNDAYNFGPTIEVPQEPQDSICKTCTAEPKRFKLEPLHQMPGPNT